MNLIKKKKTTRFSSLHRTHQAINCIFHACSFDYLFGFIRLSDKRQTTVYDCLQWEPNISRLVLTLKKNVVDLNVKKIGKISREYECVNGGY